MSASFRPVVETWGISSSCFVGPDLLVEVIETIADPEFCGEEKSAGKVEVNEYGENTSVWIQHGDKFLDYIESKTAEQHVADNDDWALSETPDLYISLFENMINLAKTWRNESVDLNSGSLTFYIDGY